MKKMSLSALLWLLPFPALACSAISAPTTITLAGEYCLIQNIVVSSGDGITVSASNVIINMNGHSIVGPGSGLNAGVYATGVSDVTVQGGNITGFFYGIRFDNGTGHRVSRMDLSDNIFRGATVLGANAVIEYNRVKGIRGAGGAYAESHSFAIETIGPATVRFNLVEEIYPYGVGEGVGISINDIGTGTAVYDNTIKFRFKPAAGRTLGIWTGGKDPATSMYQNVVVNADYGLFKVRSTANAMENRVVQRCPLTWIDADYPGNNHLEITGGCTDPEAGF